MDITLEKQNPTDASIKVTLIEADYQPKVAEKLKEYSRKAQLKGFRPGKVPPALIKKMYGKSILIDEINHMLADAVNNYIKENKLPVVGEPLPDTEQAENIDWDTQKEFEFSYNVGLVPEFSYDVAALELAQYEVDISDKDIDESIKNLQARFGNFTHPDTVSEGDFLSGKLEGADGAVNREKAFISLEQVQPETKKLFVGAKKEDTVAFDIQNAFVEAETIGRITGLSPEEASALSGEFRFTIAEIDRSEPAELNQEFFDKVVGKDTVSSEEEFRNKLRELIAENYQQEAERTLSQQVRNQLIDKTSIELPDDFLKKWLLRSNDSITQEQIDREYNDYARELKWNLIKNRIAEDNEIKVEHEEVVERTKELITQQFGSMGLGEDSEESMNLLANNFLKAEKGKNYMNIYEQVFADKILKFVQEQAPVTKKTVSTEEFRNQNSGQ